MAASWRYEATETAWILSFTYEFQFVQRPTKVIEVERVTEEQLAQISPFMILLRLKKSLPPEQVKAFERLALGG